MRNNIRTSPAQPKNSIGTGEFFGADAGYALYIYSTVKRVSPLFIKRRFEENYSTLAKDYARKHMKSIEILSSLFRELLEGFYYQASKLLSSTVLVILKCLFFSSSIRILAFFRHWHAHFFFIFISRVFLKLCLATKTQG